MTAAWREFRAGDRVEDLGAGSLGLGTIIEVAPSGYDPSWLAVRFDTFRYYANEADFHPREPTDLILRAVPSELPEVIAWFDSE